MQRRGFTRRILTLAVAVSAIASSIGSPALAQATGRFLQDLPEPPPLVATYFRSDLTGTDIFQPGTCPTGRAGGGNVEEGFQVYVQGRCVDQHNAAYITVRGQEIGVGDGEVSIEFKVLSGADRAVINLFVRVQGVTYNAAYLSFASDEVTLFKRERSGVSIVGTQIGLGEIDPQNWNRLGLRFVGAETWLLLNDVPLLYGNDTLNQEYGGIGLQVERAGSPDDEDEVAIVFRDLALSGFVAPSE